MALPEAERSQEYNLPLSFSASIVVFAGLPLVGKTTLAQALAQHSNFVPLDVEDARYPLGIPRYPQRGTPEEEKETMALAYIRNHKWAQKLLGLNTPVVLSATYSRPEYHDQLLALEHTTKKPLVVFQLEAPETVIEQRLKERQRNGSASNIQTYEQYRDVKSRYQAITGIDMHYLDTGQPINDCITKILHELSKHPQIYSFVVGNLHE